MHRQFFRALLASSVAFCVAGCSASQVQEAQLALATAGGDVLRTVDAACAEYAPVATALATAKDPAVGTYLAYGNSVCASASGAAAAGVAVDPSTAAWVGAITGALKVLAAPPKAA